MARDSRSLGWQLGLAGFLLVGGAIAFSGNPTFAHSNIVPDNSHRTANFYPSNKIYIL